MQRPHSAPYGKQRRPGPNQYKVPGAMGSQVNSRYKSQPSISFGAR